MPSALDVRLELVRPGPPHNQLLSPLTPYMALCGEGSPVTFHIDFEHRQLLNRLEHLRYVAPDAAGGFARVPDQLREAQVRELGEDMGRVLGRIPSLNAELSRAWGANTTGLDFVHVRLVLSGSELAILPFELARAPQSYPGEGLDLCLQGNLPVVVTREVRRSRPLPVPWDTRPPKLLFICAEPAGMTVPKVEHVRALRDAVDPWVEWPRYERGMGNRKDLEDVKERLRIVTDASIEKIREVCAQEDFTHVHVLAHGGHYREAGEDRFGIALCRDGLPHEKKVVDGEALAKALRSEDEAGVRRSSPVVVTLATCDSGATGSVLVPGGSIAHDLHAAGIPWVYASQFPLTKTGSVRMARFLYPRLLRGDDPRLVLYELRRLLSMTSSREHDWASIVTYSALEGDFERHLALFFESQTKKAIEVHMARIDRLAEKISGSTADDAERPALETKIGESLAGVRKLLESWELRLPDGSSQEDRTARANCFGIKGSTHKRMGLLQASLGQGDPAHQELKTALGAYREAMNQWVTDGARFNWTATQYLALCAVLDAEHDEGTLAVCRRLAERDLRSDDPDLEAWAHGTLAELELIAAFHAKNPPAGAEERVVEHCRKIMSLVGPDSFHVKSTRRQFQRYADRWRLESWNLPEWDEIAKAAVAALTPDG